MLSDTHPDAERVQIELIRKASIAERIAAMRSLTRMVTQLSRQAIADANPQAGPREVDLIWVELHYGPELARKVREYLEQNESCSPQMP